METGPAPKERFTALDTLALARELAAIVGARVDKAFGDGNPGWMLTFRAADGERRELTLVPGLYATLLREVAEHALSPAPFARELRRLLSGAQLREVVEPAGERLLRLRFSRADGESLELVVELFGPGNVMVVRGGKIVAVAKPRSWSTRSVRVGSPYAPAPERADPWSLAVPEIAESLSASKSDLVSTLAARLALGGPIAEELLARLGEAAPALGPGPLAERVHRSLGELRSEVEDPPKGFLYLKAGAPLDATPYRSRRWVGLAEERESPSFSEAAHRYFMERPRPVEPAKRSPARSAPGALERQAARQREAIDTLGREIARLRASAEAIFADFAEASRQLESARRAKNDPKTVDLRIGERTVTVAADRGLRESAQALYDEAKQLLSKQAATRRALEDTEARLEAGAGKPPAAAPPAAAARRAKPHWFERWRWFVSSEGVLVIAGRDASSNDAIVRRHLRDGDLYFHADLHGAPSVIVKRPEAGGVSVSALTRTEAGVFAVAFSKAWRAGLASASAFWVRPEQVSKRPMTGEFVARGAWVISGEKNLLKDLPLELALGTIELEGEPRWVVAPPSSVRARGTARYLLSPGDEREREAREIDLARDSGLGRSRLQALLPAGGLSVRRA